MSVRFMLDTDQISDLTPHAELLATYADLVTDLKVLQARFPNSRIILIDRGLGDPTGLASVFDVEPGALTADQAAEGYDRQHAKDVEYLTVYCSRDELPAVDLAMGARNFYRWIATLDGTATITGFTPMQAPAAVQCFSAAMLGVHADGSLVFQDQWNPTMTNGAARTASAELINTADALITVHDDLRRKAVAIGG